MDSAAGRGAVIASAPPPTVGLTRKKPRKIRAGLSDLLALAARTTVLQGANQLCCPPVPRRTRISPYCCPIRSAMLSQRTLPFGFIAPCLPTKAHTLPSGSLWLHEIKHDGFRIIARKDGERVRLYSRPGNDLTYRFPLIVESIARLRARSCIIDGEAVACNDKGMASFDRIRYRQHDGSVFLYAFDLIELNGDDLRRDPLEVRKATLASVLAKAAPGLRLNEHLEHDGGETVFRRACKLGLEGIVSKRKGSPYRSGRSPDWLKMKNPACEAVRREAEEDWGR
jgi:bifunctional non-homologous end joining protein LigD